MDFHSRCLRTLRHIGIAALLTLSSVLRGQEGNWADYVVAKEKGMMTVSVDLNFNDNRPAYKNLLIVGMQFRECMNNGHPKPEALEKLYRFSDDAFAVIDSISKNRLVGIITYQCMGFDVYYVKDTMGLRDELNRILAERHAQKSYHITIQNDRKWQYYYLQLLPNNFDLNQLMDHKLLFDMVLQGDDLSGPREIKHWIYFNREKKRSQLTEKLKSLKFSMDSLNYVTDQPSPYELQVSRKDSIGPIYIQQLTTMLRILSLTHGGIYDGWSTDLQVKP